MTGSAPLPVGLLCRGANQRLDQRRGTPIQRVAFMLEKRGDKKRVRHQLDGADLTLFIPAGDAQIALFQLTGKRAVHPVPAVVASSMLSRP
ncbi:Uncharacterised protein [Klebsiella variicola]|nr:Uncharacterised protein [Klebsiella variicola]